MKKEDFIATVIIVAIAVIITIPAIWSNLNEKKYGYSQEYIVGTGNIQGNVDTEYFLSLAEEFEIGANQFGYAVFKEPDKALEKLKLDYSEGIELIRKEYDLQPLSKRNYQSYHILVTTGTDEECEQAFFVSGFMDIYENSFEEQ